MNFNQFDLNLLRALDVLLREKNVTRAAERLHVTQQAMSNSLRRLREQFDDELLVRVGRHLELTPLGRVLEHAARDAMLQIRSTLETQVAFHPATARCHFRIGMCDYSSFIFLPRLLRRLAREAPGIKVQIVSLFDRAYVGLDSGELDFCISPWNPNLVQNYRLSDEVVRKSLFVDEFVCVTDEKLSVAGATLTLERFREAVHIVARLGDGIETVVQNAWRREDFHPVIAATAPSFAALIFALPGTPWIATTQRKLASTVAPMLGLTVHECPMPVPPLQEDIMWHRRTESSAEHMYMRSVMLEEAARL